jgi:hypothetical protein
MVFSFLVNSPQTLVSLHFKTDYGNVTMSDRPDYSPEKREFWPCLMFAEKEKTDDLANHGIHVSKITCLILSV